jgi:hypothetical protein
MRFVIFSLFLFCVSCADSGSSTPTAPYTVEVVSLLPPSEAGSPATFQIAPQVFSSLQNLDSLDGWFVQIFLGGTLKAQSVMGSIVSNGFFEGGDSPRLRYRVKNGVVVPSDYMSLALLSAYYQFDRVAARLLQVYGIDPLQLARVQKNGKYHVLFEPTLSLESSTASGTLAEKRNAAFVSGHGQFVLFERSRSEKIPLAANLQVISHEFGHAIFEHTFFDNAFSSESAYAGNFVVAGLNEGIADFTSFLWSGSGDVLSGSLTGIDAVGERNFVKSTFVLNDSNVLCSGGFYCLGTLFARSLWQVWSELSEDDRAKLTLSLPARLRAARSALDSAQITIDGESAMEASLPVQDIFPLKVFLTNFATHQASLTGQLTTKLCDRFQQNFSMAAEQDWRCP